MQPMMAPLDYRSVTKPEPTAEEGASLEVETPKRTTGSSGEAPNAPSRSVQYLIGTGKSGPLPQRRAPTGVETIIGPTDDRARVLDTDLTPWRMVCSLEMRGALGSGVIGTGWLVGPRTVITAGHCVFSRFFFGGWASEIAVIPGRNGSEMPFGRTISRRFSSVEAWVQGENPDSDIGCIHLDEDIGRTVGWFSTGALPAEDLRNHLINVSGYPGDRGNGMEQYHHRNRIRAVTDRRIYYDVDTFGGQSGAPAWIQDADGAPPTVVGIHAYGTTGTPTALGITANSAPRITPELLAQIEAWVEQDGGLLSSERKPQPQPPGGLSDGDKHEITALIASELQKLRAEFEHTERGPRSPRGQEPPRGSAVGRASRPG
jgi:glutamyl endopeptidase